MARKVRIKKRKKIEKERPFDDSDTVIQFKEDYVRDYCLEPLTRKAVETPVVERVVTETMEKDMAIVDEDDDLGTRTREKHWPAMPDEMEFLHGMRNEVSCGQLINIRNALRYYNDAVRNPQYREMAKVFLLGLIRQLRYWSINQLPQPEVSDGETATEWVLSDLVPMIEEDMSLLSKHFSPEIDKVYFRRWGTELGILKGELQLRNRLQQQAKEDLQAAGYDPEDPSAQQRIPLPETNVWEWVSTNPDLVEIVLDDPSQRDILLAKVQSELFNVDSNIDFMNLLDELALKAQHNGQQTAHLERMITLASKGDRSKLRLMLEDHSLGDLHRDLSCLLESLQKLHLAKIFHQMLSRYSAKGSEIITKSGEDQSPLIGLIESVSAGNAG